MLASAGAVLVLLGIVGEADATAPQAAVAALHRHADMAKFIAAVRESEARYRSLEFRIRWTREFIPSEGQIEPSPPPLLRKIHAVEQADLFYCDMVQRDTEGDARVRVEEIAAYDGQRSVSIVTGNTANVHSGRVETPYLTPPHVWALFDHEVNFPLSDLLQGTEALAANPKVHRYPVERGSVYEFPYFETELVGEEMWNGLRCARVRCSRRQFSDNPPYIWDLWIALDRNHLCVRQQTRRKADSAASSESQVTAFRENNGLWLPEVVEAASYDYEALQEGNQVARAKYRLHLDEAAVDPDKPAEFFRVEIPQDLPRFDLEGNELAGNEIIDREPTSDSAKRCEELLRAIRSEEAKYENLEIEVQELFRTLTPGMASQTVSKSSRQHSVIHPAKRWYAERSSARSATAETFESRSIQLYVEPWMRWFREERRSGPGGERQEESYSIRRGSAEAGPPVLWPHMFLLESQQNSQRLSEYLAALENGEYPYRLSYLGEVEWDGLRCDVLRLQRHDESTSSHYRIIWIARERNCLPLRMESYSPDWAPKLPTVQSTATDLREVAPGVWFPYRTQQIRFETWSLVDLSVGRMVMHHRRDKEVLNVSYDQVSADDARFNGPIVPAGEPVTVSDENGETIGTILQDRPGPLAISDEAYGKLAKHRAER